MVQGTMSNAGKSLVTAGLCRVFNQDGYKVAPFKSQNMALNSFITRNGAEMGRAQVVQAEAANIEPSALMNPILLKPTSDSGSQVIVNGEAIGTMTAAEYFKFKTNLIPDIIMVSSSTIKQLYIITPFARMIRALHCCPLFCRLSVLLQRDMYGNPGEFSGFAVIQQPVPGTIIKLQAGIDVGDPYSAEGILVACFQAFFQ